MDSSQRTAKRRSRPSMRPRHFCPGYRRLKAVQFARPPPSMRPRHFCPGYSTHTIPRYSKSTQNIFESLRKIPKIKILSPSSTASDIHKTFKNKNFRQFKRRLENPHYLTARMGSADCQKKSKPRIKKTRQLYDNHLPLNSRKCFANTRDNYIRLIC